MFSNGSSGKPSLSRRRGARSDSKLALTSTSLFVFGAIILTTFIIGLMIGSHSMASAVAESAHQSGGGQLSSSLSAKAMVDEAVSLKEANKLLESAKAETAALLEREKVIRAAKGLRGAPLAGDLPRPDDPYFNAPNHHDKDDVQMNLEGIRKGIAEEEDDDTMDLGNVVDDAISLEDGAEGNGPDPDEPDPDEPDPDEPNPDEPDPDVQLESDFPYLGDDVLNTHSYEPKGGHRFSEWKDGDTPFVITESLKQKSDELARKRREHVKAGMQHAWSGYKKHAFGSDEVLPITGGKNNNWGGIGTTLVDSLDTLWLMDMKEEFWEARDWVRDKLSHDSVGDVSVFETTIRSLGGLLSAYDWSGDKAFLEKAHDLGKKMFPAFNAKSGIPYGHVNMRNGRASNAGWTGGNAIIAEAGTIEIEYRYLSKVTGNKDYLESANHVFEQLKSIEPSNGLYPYYVRNSQSTPSFGNNKITFGAMADSLYEYMLKIWLQGGKQEPMYREMYDKSMDGMHDELLQKSSPSGLWYIADKNNGRLDHKMDHLVCFMGGLLTLGAYTDPQGLDSARAQRDLKTGKALTYTCYQMYARMPTGIAPEFVRFQSNDFVSGNAQYYILRPETVESFYILNKLTGDPIYREWGWEVFQSIEKYCRTDIAYGSVHNVNVKDAKPENRMESFFLAETMKYLYLLMDPDSEVDIINKHVFNTEAHPMRMFDLLGGIEEVS